MHQRRLPATRTKGNYRLRVVVTRYFHELKPRQGQYRSIFPKIRFAAGKRKTGLLKTFGHMKPTPRVIIVDDDADDREIIRDAFATSRPDAEYLFVDNGERLMTLLNETENPDLPSLIIIDLNMPGKDGRAALREIKNSERFHCIPTVVLTTSSSARDRQAAYQLGANCFITKPDTFQKMIALASSISRLWLEA